MHKVTKKERKTCPACNGNGTEWGTRYCRHCVGSGFITETTTWTVEEVSR